MSNIAEYRPCTGYCQMIGAAAALLSIKGTAVIFNGPRWCSVIGERILGGVNKDYEERLFCSEANQESIVYGVEKTLSVTIQEVLSKGQPGQLAILTSCSMSLIGDDIAGICKQNKVTCPVITIEAGGLTGDFASGYQMALRQVIMSCLQPRGEKSRTRVNLLGVCTSRPHWQGDLWEVERLLRCAGYEVGVVPGEEGLTLNQWGEIGRAGLNVVLDGELGLDAAKLLQEEQGQAYVVASWPYGLQGSIDWLQKIGTALAAEPQLDNLLVEVKTAERDIFDEWALQKKQYHSCRLQQIVVHGPMALAESLRQEIVHSKFDFLDAAAIYISDGWTDHREIKKMLLPGEAHWQDADQIAPLQPDCYQILLSSEEKRIVLGDYDKTLYLNFAMPMDRIKAVGTFYAGIRGWQNFVGSLLSQLNTLEYIKISRSDDA